MVDLETCEHKRQSSEGGPLGIDICLDCGAIRDWADSNPKWVDFARIVKANLVAGNVDAAFHGLKFMQAQRQNGIPYPTLEEFKERYIIIVPDNPQAAITPPGLPEESHQK